MATYAGKDTCGARALVHIDNAQEHAQTQIQVD